MRHPEVSLPSSKCSIRGWTFQEALLSRRNLVFLDEQMYFKCKAKSCYEGISYPLDRVHVKNGSEIRDFLRAGLIWRTSTQAFRNFDLTTLKATDLLSRFISVIEQYSARDLRYDDDSLNAFAGIIKATRYVAGASATDFRSAVRIFRDRSRLAAEYGICPFVEAYPRLLAQGESTAS